MGAPCRSPHGRTHCASQSSTAAPQPSITSGSGPASGGVTGFPKDESSVGARGPVPRRLSRRSVCPGEDRRPRRLPGEIRIAPDSGSCDFVSRMEMDGQDRPAHASQAHPTLQFFNGPLGSRRGPYQVHCTRERCRAEVGRLPGHDTVELLCCSRLCLLRISRGRVLAQVVDDDGCEAGVNGEGVAGKGQNTALSPLRIAECPCDCGRPPLALEGFDPAERRLQWREVNFKVPGLHRDRTNGVNLRYSDVSALGSGPFQTDKSRHVEHGRRTRAGPRLQNEESLAPGMCNAACLGGSLRQQIGNAYALDLGHTCDLALDFGIP